jgi:MraZ protein
VSAGGNQFGGYYGSFTHGVDASHRVMLPSEWRPSDPDFTFTLLPWPLTKPEYLLVLAPARWDEMQNRMRAQISLTNEAGAAVERKIYGSAVKLRLDRVGRLCLGEELRTRFGIGKEAKLVGRGEKFEIWDAEKLVAKSAQEVPITQATLDALTI